MRVGGAPNGPPQGQGQEASALNSPCLSRDAGTCPGPGLALGQPRARGRVQNPREPATSAEGQTESVVSRGGGAGTPSLGEEEACDLGLEGQVRCQQNVLGMEPRGRQYVEILNSPPLPPAHSTSEPSGRRLPLRLRLPGRPGPGLAKPSLLRVRPLVEGSDCDLWAWEPRSQDHSFP